MQFSINFQQPIFKLVYPHIYNQYKDSIDGIYAPIQLDVLMVGYQVGVFSSYECEEFRNFTSVASELRSQYEFRHTMDSSFLPTKSTPLVESPVIRVFKNFDEGYDDLKVPSFMQTLSQVDAELLTYSNYSVSNEACFQLICFP